MIYLDNSATTRPYPEVLALYTKLSNEYFGNPSSLHTLGMEAEKILNQARKKMATFLDCSSNQLIFTSGGTEANALALYGTVKRHSYAHIITTTVEHASVYENLQALQQSGYDVTYLQADQFGRVTVDQVKEAIQPSTVLVSIGHVQGELGTIQPIEEIGKVLQSYPQIKFHVDAVQSLLKVPFSIIEAGIDLMTLSAHKVHGTKGTGLLFSKNPKTLESLTKGGSQEQMLRPGTENTAGIACFAKAISKSAKSAVHEQKRLKQLMMHLRSELEQIKGVRINTPKEGTAPHILNFSIPSVKAEVLVQALGYEKIYVSTQSACSTKTGKPSRILLGCGLDEKRARSSIRISLSFETKKEEIDICIKTLHSIIPKLQEVMK